jgi:hypothetical protein
MQFCIELSQANKCKIALIFGELFFTMSQWLFLDYRTEDRVYLIREWYRRQDGAVRAAFDATVTLLAEKPDWSKTKMVKELTREHTGLTELVINIKRQRPFRHIRPVGIWRPEERLFIFLTGCEKYNRVYIPENAFNEALKYKAHFEAGRGTIHGHFQ